MSQQEQVLKLLEKGPLSPLQALREVGTMRLASYVHRLRQQGYTILGEPVVKAGKRFTVYHLAGKK